MTEEQWRADTPASRDLIHFNNAGAALMPQPVVTAMQDYITHEANLGGYEAADATKSQQEGFYDAVASLLGCKATNIAFASSATNAFARALSCIPFQAGDKILMANEDYISNQLAFLSLRKRFGVELLRANSLPEGGVDLDHFRHLAKQHRPRLVSLTHVPTNSGLVQPAEEVGKICRAYDLIYLLDACQSIGQLPLDVNKLQCHFLSATFRKFLRGPRGAGFLYVSDSILQQPLEPLFIDMRGAQWTAPNQYAPLVNAQRFEDWEIPYVLMAGARVAVNYAQSVGIETIKNRNQLLCTVLREQLSAIGLPTLDRGHELSSIITVYVPAQHPTELMQRLRTMNINSSISYGDYALIDFTTKQVPWALRLSPHYYSTETEVHAVVEALRQIISTQ